MEDDNGLFTNSISYAQKEYTAARDSLPMLSNATKVAFELLEEAIKQRETEVMSTLTTIITPLASQTAELHGRIDSEKEKILDVKNLLAHLKVSTGHQPENAANPPENATRNQAQPENTPGNQAHSENAQRVTPSTPSGTQTQSSSTHMGAISQQQETSALRRSDRTTSNQQTQQQSPMTSGRASVMGRGRGRGRVGH